MRIPDLSAAEVRPGDTIVLIATDDGVTTFTVERPVPPLVLPTEPGTVIAIGEWWLVLLAPYEGLTEATAWELLPFRSVEERERAEQHGAKQQCVYGSSWVLAEAEQHGGFEVIAAPKAKVELFGDDARVANLTAAAILAEVQPKLLKNPYAPGTAERQEADNRMGYSGGFVQGLTAALDAVSDACRRDRNMDEEVAKIQRAEKARVVREVCGFIGSIRAGKTWAEIRDNVAKEFAEGTTT